MNKLIEVGMATDQAKRGNTNPPNTPPTHTHPPIDPLLLGVGFGKGSVRFKESTDFQTLTLTRVGFKEGSGFVCA